MEVKSSGLSNFLLCVVPKVSNGIHSGVSIDVLKASDAFPTCSHCYLAKFLSSQCFCKLELQVLSDFHMFLLRVVKLSSHLVGILHLEQKSGIYKLASLSFPKDWA